MIDASAGGLLVVDKPPGWTSHDVVARIRRLAGTRRVGHAGTLDPMATGVLVIGIGKGTKLLTFLVGCDKAYAATVRLGQATVTDDAEGEVTETGDVGSVTDAQIAAAVATLTGEIDQIPSSVSAIKVAGVRSYARVRGGEQVELAARRVRVSHLDVLAIRPADADGHPVLDLDIVVEVSSGTYVRALARDLGDALGAGGHLTALRRTRVGPFEIAQAHDLADLATTVQRGDVLPITPLAAAARAALPVRELTDEQARATAYGQPVISDGPRQGAVAAFAPDGSLVAVLDQSAARARTRVVFASAAS